MHERLQGLPVQEDGRRDASYSGTYFDALYDVDYTLCNATCTPFCTAPTLVNDVCDLLVVGV